MNRHAQPQFWVTNHLANPILRRLLRRPAGRGLGRRLALVRYRGRRTGRSYELPVQYAADGDRIWILPGSPEHKTWWRNLRGGADVDLVLAGRPVHGRAMVLDRRQPGFADGLSAYLRAMPGARRAAGRLGTALPDPGGSGRGPVSDQVVLVRVDLAGEMPTGLTVASRPTGSWHPSPEVLAGIGGAVRLAAAVITAPAGRHWYNRWGATPAEAAAAMPGDDLVPHPKMASTRAITIGVPPAEVWAWLVQIGQGRGGFYSYDALENLARCDIHSASQIIPRFQGLQPGDLVRLAPGRAPCFRAVTVEPGRVLVLAAADPVTQVVQPAAASPDELASTWQWLLRPVDGGRGTRLVARQRYSYPRGQSVMWHLVEPVSFVMERRMLHGIKARAETHTRQTWPAPAEATF
jgi:F420H(2)-dependent quinone reductase